MKIKRIKFQNYTVFEDQQMEFSPGINVIIGENGTGKTHLMKALYSACQSADKKTSLRRRKYLMADETRVQVLNEPERNPGTDSWMWIFRSGEDGLPPILLCHYTETGAKFHAASFLQGFSGYLETDGYQGYNNLPDIKRCSCWAHVRRYFTDAIPKGKEYDYSLPAVQGVQFCCKLFDCERYSKQKITLRSRENNFVLKRRSRYWRHSGIGWINSAQTREPVWRKR